jgi:hypothetical protein
MALTFQGFVVSDASVNVSCGAVEVERDNIDRGDGVVVPIPKEPPVKYDAPDVLRRICSEFELSYNLHHALLLPSTKRAP